MIVPSHIDTQHILNTSGPFTLKEDPIKKIIHLLNFSKIIPDAEMVDALHKEYLADKLLGNHPDEPKHMIICVRDNPDGSQEILVRVK